ncbi:MAG: hypothetical protein V2A73_09225 [Pseudomonadota bacterium]
MLASTQAMEPRLDAQTKAVFQEVLFALREEGLRFIIGGAFALNHFTGVWRFTKDLDVFCEPRVGPQVLAALRKRGFASHLEEKHWLGKAFKNDALVDVIWGCGNWTSFVDESWYCRAVQATILGENTLVACPADIILSKSYVAGRERFDGTDIAHLIHSCGRTFDWPALVNRFGDHWLLLLHYLVLFRFVYPQEREIAPTSLIRDLALNIGTDAEVSDGLAFRGPLLDRYGYLHDMLAHGWPDPREVLAARAGLPIADVELRRQLDKEALEAGVPYKREREGCTPVPDSHGCGSLVE